MFHIFHKWDYSGLTLYSALKRIRKCRECGRIEEEKYYGERHYEWVWEKVK